MLLGNVVCAGRGTTSWTPVRRCAIAATELAIIAAFLVSLVFAILELGRGIMVKQALTDSARRGARLAAQPGTTTAAINTEVKLLLSNDNIPTANVTITVLVNGNNVNASTAVQNDKISVQVAVPVSAVYWLGTVFLKSSSVESETVTMICATTSSEIIQRTGLAMLFVTSRFARRRGAVAPLVALLVIFLMGMVAFAVDIGWIVLTESELKNAADAAALAGVKPLMDGYVQYNLPGLTAAQQSTILTAAENSAIAKAQAYASYHTAGGVSNLTLNSGDIQFGFTNASGTYSTTFTGFPNTIKVTMRRDSSANGALTLFVAPVLGVKTTSITASAAATMYGGTVSSLQTTLTNNVSMLPVTYDVNNWNNFMSTGLSPDGTSTLSGGYSALEVYPSVKDPGNFGQLSLDGSHVGASTEIGWVNNGLAQSDVNGLFSAGLLPVSSTNTDYDWVGDTGMKSSLISAINARAGTQFLLPLFTPYNAGVPVASDYAAGTGEGSHYYYAIVQFVGVTVVSGSSGVTVQPSAFLDPNLVFSSTPVPVGTGTGVVTTFAAPKLTQ